MSKPYQSVCDGFYAEVLIAAVSIVDEVSAKLGTLVGQHQLTVM